jgi:hypothetical protein
MGQTKRELLEIIDEQSAEISDLRDALGDVVDRASELIDDSENEDVDEDIESEDEDEE